MAQTIHDIARIAGVCIGTVSRVLNNKDRVHQETRQRSQRIIDKTGYRPSAMARALVTRRSYGTSFSPPSGPATGSCNGLHPNSNFLVRKCFLVNHMFMAAVVIVLLAATVSRGENTLNWDQVAAKWECPEWFKDAKFGLWLHWGPQTVPAAGGGWYARHMYMEPKDLQREKWGLAAWNYHRATFGHQSVAGYKEVCNAWKAEKFDADATITQFKKWGARYVATMGNHHDNFDLFASSVHGWNATKVGPQRDMVGDFAAAARRQNLKWAVSVHVARTRKWLAPAFGSDSEGPKKGIPYDGNLTKKDGKGTWWEGLDPQQLYALNYAPFETELAQRHLELTSNYKPDMLYFDDRQIPAPMSNACAKLYADSLENNSSIQAIVTVKGPQKGTVLDYEKGVAEGIRNEYWQTDTTIADDWFLKPNPDGSSKMLHNARSLKELLVDIVSKRGVLLLNIAIRGDGTIPQDQIAEMDVLGTWLEGNGEAIYDSRPWIIYGEGGETTGGHFNERGIASQPWDHNVRRFTCNKANTILYVHVFGDPTGKDIIVASLAKEKNLFSGMVHKVSVLGSTATVDWALQSDGLHVKMPGKLPCKDCNVLKVEKER